MHPVQVPKGRYLLSKEMSYGVHKVLTPGVTRFLTTFASYQELGFVKDGSL